MLRYKAAAYLNQEVQLLNDEIAETARRRCYVPYVVKLKLAFMPYVNPLPLSAHTQITFLQGLDAQPPTYPIRSERDSSNDDARRRSVDRGCVDPGTVPVVVPFLAADDLQLAANSNTAEVARQIALAASFMAHGFTVNANANRLYEALTAIQNQEMHSSLTVSRTVNNGLYVLIAPNNEATGNAALVGQTYDVAVLLLVPRSYFGPDVVSCQCVDRHAAQISITTYTELRETRSGRPLQDSDDSITAANIDRVLRLYLRDDDLKKLHTLSVRERQGLLAPYIGPVQDGDFGKFKRALVDNKNQCPDSRLNLEKGLLCLDPDYGPALWSGLTALNVDSPYKTADFYAPLPVKISIPKQNAVITDDSSGTVTVILSDVEGASASTLAGSLSLLPSVTPTDDAEPKTPKHPEGGSKAKTQPKAEAGPPLNLAAQSLTLDPNAHTLTMTFASPGKAGVAKLWDKGPPNPDANMLKVSQVGCDASKLCPEFQPVSLPVNLEPIKSPPASTLGFQLVDAGNTVLFDTSGSATLPITINAMKTNVTVALTFAGAAVNKVTDPTGKLVSLSKDGFELTAPGVYTVSVANLLDGSTLTVTASGSTPTPGALPSATGSPATTPTGTVNHTFVAMPSPAAGHFKGT